ncbi:MAG: class I SAM-dependent methyltransferase [Polyangiaceae bacterium]|nr:class I SAM-dependent methyltransferase [Polyangiaceae bacterium]
MSHRVDEEHIRSYYDDFAAKYEDQRRPRRPDGYHALVDDLEVDYTLRFARGRDVLEVGCGTGLILERLVPHCRSAKGVDLSPGMLEPARARGLDVHVGSATALPFPDDSFDVVCSFKVLAHVPEIERALGEMLRVARSDGYVLAEMYNPWSLRALAKKLGPAGATSARRRESDVYTRFDAPWQVRRLLPYGAQIVGSRGVRVITPTAAAMRVPGVGKALRKLEWKLADSKLSVFGGFWIAAIQKTC